MVTTYPDIINLLSQIDPLTYAHSRNYLNGAVTRLSPYISRGVISTRQVLDDLLQKGFVFEQLQQLVKELAWRDYFQRVLQHKPTLFREAIRQEDRDFANHEIPLAMVAGKTGIEVIDRSVNDLYTSGYMHNHARMYVASLACNIARSHWRMPAQWMYYHLLDADVASNYCSWQWVAGVFSQKKYFANQENINRFGDTQQSGTFLDFPYATLPSQPVPEILQETGLPDLTTTLPGHLPLSIDAQKPTAIYNFYNLDPLWRKEEDLNRVLLLEPSHFKTHPVSENTILFIQNLAKNIPGLQFFTGEFSEFKRLYPPGNIFYKEHPLFAYEGEEDSRDWLFPEVTGWFPSFFSYWKQCAKYI